MSNNQERENGPFDKQEQIVSMLLTNANNAFMQLESNAQTQQEWVTSLHRLQDILHHRVLYRDYPNHFSKP